MQLNASRIKVLQAQDDIVNAMKDQAAKDLLNVSRDEYAYKQLLKDLIVQVGTFIQNRDYLRLDTFKYWNVVFVYPTGDYVTAFFCRMVISFLWSVKDSLLYCCSVCFG